MTETPMHSDKDNIIENLKRQLEEKCVQVRKLKSRIESMEMLTQEKKIKRNSKIPKVLIPSFISLVVVMGVSYMVYLLHSNEVKLEKRCTILCRMVLGEFSISGDETMAAGGGCGESARHCTCETRENKVNLASTSYDELMGDLLKIKKNLNVEAWESCMNLRTNTATKVSCDFVPWRTKFDGRQK